MNSVKIRPEWVPSGYKEATKTDQVDNVKVYRVKPTLYTRKNIFIKQAFKQTNLK